MAHGVHQGKPLQSNVFLFEKFFNLHLVVIFSDYYVTLTETGVNVGNALIPKILQLAEEGKIFVPSAQKVLHPFLPEMVYIHPTARAQTKTPTTKPVKKQGNFSSSVSIDCY